MPLGGGRRREPIRQGGGGAPKVGAVVVGGDYQGLGIARSLGRYGVPVVVVDDEASIARVSRYVSHFERVPSLRGPDETVDAVTGLADRLDLRGWVLFPTREETVAAFSTHRDRLAQRYRVPTPPWETIRRAWDKRETYTLARELGVDVPRCWFPRREEDLDREEIRAAFPVVIKPAIKENFIYATKAKAWRANTPEELADAYRRACQIVDPGEIIVQEMIPGSGAEQLAYCAFFRAGGPVASMTVRRRRQHPSDFGRASTYVETVGLPEIEEPSERFLKAIDYYGLVELEYKRDPRDGLPKLLDVNARTWGYHSLGAAAGVDFPYLLYLDQLGREIEDGVRARAGVRWIRWATDIPNAVKDLSRGDLSLSAYTRTLRGVDVEAVWSRRDPLPTLLELGLMPYLAFRRGL
jgi:D-aspartate ligase